MQSLRMANLNSEIEEFIKNKVSPERQYTKRRRNPYSLSLTFYLRLLFLVNLILRILKTAVEFNLSFFSTNQSDLYQKKYDQYIISSAVKTAHNKCLFSFLQKVTFLFLNQSSLGIYIRKLLSTCCARKKDNKSFSVQYLYFIGLQSKN